MADAPLSELRIAYSITRKCGKKSDLHERSSLRTNGRGGERTMKRLPVTVQSGLRIYCADRTKRIGRKHPAHREAIGMAGCRNSSAEG